MIVFQVKDMSCNHCVGAITEALAAVDAGARLQVDLAARQVRIEATSADPRALAQAIEAAGYTPVSEPPATGTAAASGVAATATATNGCCCRR